MRKTPVALLTLLMGAALGVLVGFTVGSGKAISPGSVDAGWNSIPPSGESVVSNHGSIVAEPAGRSGSIRRALLEPSFDELVAQFEKGANGLSGELIAGTVESAESTLSTEADAPESAAAALQKSTITGLVIDEKGQPIAGATVTTVMTAPSSLLMKTSTSRIGRG